MAPPVRAARRRLLLGLRAEGGTGTLFEHPQTGRRHEEAA